MPSHYDLENLIHAYLDGVLTEEEASRLSELLVQSEEARDKYWRIAAIHGLLENALQHEWLGTPHLLKPKNSGFLSRLFSSLRPLGLGAALGGLTASAVWAYAVPLARVFRELPLFNGGFEAAPTEMGALPLHEGEWRGDPTEVTGTKGRVSPRSGDKMVRFVRLGLPPDTDKNPYACSDLWQVIKLPPGGKRTATVRAYFNTDTSRNADFHVAALACSGPIESAGKLWQHRAEGYPGVHSFGRTMTTTDTDPATWQEAEVTIGVPLDADYIIVGIAAYRLGEQGASKWFPGQFADDVSIRISDDVAGL